MAEATIRLRVSLGVLDVERCEECGAIVADIEQHRHWHRKLAMVDRDVLALRRLERGRRDG